VAGSAPEAVAVHLTGVPSGAGDGIEGNSDIEGCAASGVESASNAEKLSNGQVFIFLPVKKRQPEVVSRGCPAS
jgi:hypothetical protein